MPSPLSTSSLPSALHSLPSAHAIKQTLQDPLNLDLASPDVAGVSPPLRTSPAWQGDDDDDDWLLSDDEKDDRERVDSIRPRCDSRESVAMFRGNGPDTLTASKGRKRMCTEPSPVPVKRKRVFKRCNAMRNIRFDGDNWGSHDNGGSDALDEFNCIEGSTPIPTYKEDGLTTWMVPNRPMARLPTRARDTSIVDLIAAEEEAAKSLNLIGPSAFGGVRLHQRFEVSIRMKTKHIVMWDVDLNQTYALEGLLYVKDAKAQTTDFPLSPVDSISIDWHTVDSCQRVPSMADDTIYATSFRGGVAPLLGRPEVLQNMDPTNGIYKDVSWEWIAPSVPGTGLGGGWALRFWVPVPMWIFKGRDVARSLVSASVVFRDGDDNDTFTADAGTVDVTIEHRMCARDMNVSG